MEYFDEENLKQKLDQYLFLLSDEEATENTIRKYKTNITSFIKFVKNKEISKNTIKEFKNKLEEVDNYLTSTSNNYLVTINRFLDYIGYGDLKVKLFKSQRKSKNKEYIEYSDYHRLLRISEKKGYIKINLIMQIFVETGIRVSELEYFKVENLNETMQVKNKGKTRTIIIRKKLLKEIKKYCKKNNISSGYIFSGRTRTKVLSDSAIRKQLKKIAGYAKVKLSKVHPHSFRHYFAVKFLETYPDDIGTLSIILGHSSIETTRIYLGLSDKQIEKRLRNIKF